MRHIITSLISIILSVALADATESDLLFTPSLTVMEIRKSEALSLSFEASVPSFPSSTAPVYYMLEGVDHTWNASTPEESKLKRVRATYPDLRTGTYTFRLRSTLNPTAPESSIIVTVLPPGGPLRGQ